MSASEREQGSGGQPARLQPVPSDAPAVGTSRDLRAVAVSSEEAAEGLRPGQDAIAAALTEDRLARRLADQELLRRLERDGFAGAEYDMLAEELAAYAIPVMRCWIFSGYIFTATAAQGYPLHPTEVELQELREEPELRGDLARITVARTLPFFRKRALVEGGWSVEGGANLTTYFIGACTQVFPNEFRRHHTERAKWRPIVRTGNDYQLDTVTHASHDPADITIGDLWVSDIVKSLPPKQQAVVILTFAGYTQAEIAEMLDLASERAVEGIIYRVRTAQKKEEGR